jgi:hypothetical protein
MIRAPFREVENRDAIDTSLEILERAHKMFGESVGGFRDLSISHGDLERITKVILVGIGELSK